MNMSPVVIRPLLSIGPPLGAAPRPERSGELDLPAGAGQRNLDLRVGELHLRQQNSLMNLSVSQEESCVTALT